MAKDMTEIKETLRCICVRLNYIQMKLDGVIQQQEDDRVLTLGKFEDYMKNVDKLNAMINEFKGCVSLARAAITERKKIESVKKKKKADVASLEF